MIKIVCNCPNRAAVKKYACRLFVVGAVFQRLLNPSYSHIHPRFIFSCFWRKNAC